MKLYLHITNNRKQMEQRIMGGLGEKNKVNKTKQTTEQDHPSSILSKATLLITHFSC